MRAIKADSTSQRIHNRRLILDHLRRLGPLTRTQLTQLTGLSAGAVTAVTGELLGESLLREGTLDKGGLGRPATPLDIHYARHTVVGLKLRHDALEGVLTDLSTQVLARVSVPLTTLTPETVVDQVEVATGKLLQDAQADPGHLLGVGLAMPGIVDAVRGHLITSPHLGWREVPIARLIADRLGRTVVVDNNVNAFAAAERLFGHGKDVENFLAVTVGHGVGAGLVIDGAVYRGRSGAAGEFGHVLTEAGGRQCQCGRRGCLEAYASEVALLQRFVEFVPEERGLTIERFLTLVESRHSVAELLLHDAGARTGRALGDVVNMLSPDMIVIGGEGVRLGALFFDALRDALHERTYLDSVEDMPVYVDAWADDAWARGAASLVIEQAFQASLLPVPLLLPSSSS